jgi:hypothetical protein
LQDGGRYPSPRRPPSTPPKANTNQIAVNEMNQNRFTIIQGDINMRAVQLTAYGNPLARIIHKV